MLAMVKIATLIANFTNLALINLQQIQYASSTKQMGVTC